MDAEAHFGAKSFSPVQISQTIFCVGLTGGPGGGHPQKSAAQKDVWPAPSASDFSYVERQSVPTYPVSAATPGKYGDPRIAAFSLLRASQPSYCSTDGVD
jgi:hypothetical protein